MAAKKFSEYEEKIIQEGVAKHFKELRKKEIADEIGKRIMELEYSGKHTSFNITESDLANI